MAPENHYIYHYLFGIIILVTTVLEWYAAEASDSESGDRDVVP